MAKKYNYSRKGLKGLNPFPFLGEVKTRLKAIEAAPATIPQSIFSANILASELHPAVQYVKVRQVTEYNGAKSFTLVPNKEKNTDNLAYFRAGQYVSVALDIDGAFVNKPYTICSNPKDALSGSYCLTIKATNPGFASKYILENWKEGTEVKLSGPLGEFYYEGLRDAKNVIAIAGGSGITPFFSMAGAIKDGIEDFNLTILYGSRTSDNILLKDELEAIANQSNGKVKVVHVLSDEEKEGYEHGFVSAELIKKYAPEGEYSVFLCGPTALYAYEKEQMKLLGLKKKFYRMELSGDSRIKTENEPQTFNLTVVIKGEKTTIKTNSDEPLLWTMEKAGIKAPSHCRSGECGWCHSRLVSGEVYVPEDKDGRRLADKKFGWIHPCASYALSDIELEVFPTE